MITLEWGWPRLTHTCPLGLNYIVVGLSVAATEQMETGPLPKDYGLIFSGDLRQILLGIQKLCLKISWDISKVNREQIFIVLPSGEWKAVTEFVGANLGQAFSCTVTHGLWPCSFFPKAPLQEGGKRDPSGSNFAGWTSSQTCHLGSHGTQVIESRLVNVWVILSILMPQIIRGVRKPTNLP